MHDVAPFALVVAVAALALLAVPRARRAAPDPYAAPLPAAGEPLVPAI